MKRLNNNLIALTLCVCFFLINSASAKIPEPSNIIHGTLYIGGTQILQSNTDFMAGCKPPSRSSCKRIGDAKTGTTPDPEKPAPEFKLTSISILATVSKSSEVVLFQVLSSNEFPVCTLNMTTHQTQVYNQQMGCLNYASRM